MTLYFTPGTFRGGKSGEVRDILGGKISGVENMASTAIGRATTPKGSRAKVAWTIAFVLMTIFVVYGKNQGFFDPKSPVAQHFAPAMAILIPHAIFAGIALILGIFQFSNRLRARYLKVHRAFGYIYAVCALVGGPTGILVSIKLGPPDLVMASITQTAGWLTTLGIALYFVRTGNIAEHRRWMIRSYPFAAVFSVARLFVPIGMKLAGDHAGLVQAVWFTIAMAAFLPNVYLEWPKIAAAKKKVGTPIALAGD
jgi:uncharacterized membrane protein YozB (DUF420 family)